VRGCWAAALLGRAACGLRRAALCVQALGGPVRPSLGRPVRLLFFSVSFFLFTDFPLTFDLQLQINPFKFQKICKFKSLQVQHFGTLISSKIKIEK
jgi:hypothetical protein